VTRVVITCAGFALDLFSIFTDYIDVFRRSHLLRL